MSLYKVKINGCDDTTEFIMEMTEEQLELVKSMCALSKSASTHHCQPTMEVADSVADEK